MQAVLALVRRFPLYAAVAVFAAVGFVFRDFFSGNVADLKVGDCVDLPSLVKDATVKDVQHHPCSDAHSGEVFFIGTIASAAFPTASEVQSFLKSQCVPAYSNYTGHDFLADADYDLYWLEPTSDGWQKGDRTIDCIVVRLDDKPIKGSLRRR